MRFLFFAFLTLCAPALLAGNRLAGESSLYLRQHAEQPIDWYPWGPAALEKARSENKLIFVSVGYAACHWCHVMAAESFENQAIAKLLNAHFVSIKIDRERRPDLDEQFGFTTNLLTGSSGWPNSVFLTPGAKPFYAGGYFPALEFTQTLTALSGAWQTDRPNIQAAASQTADQVRQYLDQSAVLGEASSADITRAALGQLRDLDAFSGGFGTAPKFPREPLLLFLLDQAARGGNAELLHAVTVTLDGMIQGGVHDQIGGGFHRYAIDPEWQIPHFEKMLYTQALMGRVLLRAYALTGVHRYKRAAERTFDYVLRDMRAPGGAFYAAQDADTVLPMGKREEGRFYVWTPQQVTTVLGAQAKDIITALNIEEDGNFDGHSIPNTVNAQNLSQYGSALDKLRRARAKRVAPITDTKIILSWNAEMIATLAEAASVLDRGDYLHAARKAADFLFDTMTTQDGLNRIYFEGQSDTSAQLADVAAFGLAMLALYDHQAPGDWLDRAAPMAAMLKDYTDPGRALRMIADTSGLGPIRPLDDTELSSGNALALAFLAGLDRRMARAGKDAASLGAITARDALAQPGARAGLLAALEAHRAGPSGSMRVSPGGAVHVLALPDRDQGQLRVTLRIRDGWHINAHAPLEDYLIGLALDVDGTPLPAKAYPSPTLRYLGFSDSQLALYETEFHLDAPLVFPETGPAKATLTLQACSDEVCLSPDDMVFYIWPDSPVID